MGGDANNDETTSGNPEKHDIQDLTLLNSMRADLVAGSHNLMSPQDRNGLYGFDYSRIWAAGNLVTIGTSLWVYNQPVLLQFFNKTKLTMLAKPGFLSGTVRLLMVHNVIKAMTDPFIGAQTRTAFMKDQLAWSLRPEAEWAAAARFHLASRRADSPLVTMFRDEYPGNDVDKFPQLEKSPFLAVIRDGKASKAVDAARARNVLGRGGRSEGQGQGGGADTPFLFPSTPRRTQQQQQKQQQQQHERRTYDDRGSLDVEQGDSNAPVEGSQVLDSRGNGDEDKAAHNTTSPSTRGSGRQTYRDRRAQRRRLGSSSSPPSPSSPSSPPLSRPPADDFDPMAATERVHMEPRATSGDGRGTKVRVNQYGDEEIIE
jgi:hypothetical protein